MQSQSYGSTSVGNRPPCWGRPDVYDAGDRECRGCGFQTTCRAQVIKLTPTQQISPVNSPAPYYTTYAPYAPQPAVQPAPVPAPVPAPITRYQPPAPAPMMPVAPPTYTAPVKVATQPTQTVHPQVHQQMLAQDWYGRMQDPLFFTVLSPPPFRPQMQGENFGERVLKNLALDLAAMAAGHLMLALRQMLLPPGQEQRK